MMMIMACQKHQKGLVEQIELIRAPPVRASRSIIKFHAQLAMPAPRTQSQLCSE